MPLTVQLAATIADAMRARDQVRLSALRMLKAALMNKEVERGRPLNDAEELQVVASMVKQRKDSIDQFARAGRQELVDKEKAELAVIESYLPPAIAVEELQRIVGEVIAEMGASSSKDVGMVMKGVMARLAGAQVDGKAVNELVRRRLAG